MGDATSVFDSLTAALGARGLNVWLPLDAAAFDAACAPLGSALRLEGLLPGARGALVVGSGGPAFFARFARERDPSDARPEPLDRYTRAVVETAAREVLTPLGVAHAELFPFVGERAGPGGGVVPFQRLGRAAGLGAPGPLGLQIHPTYGPWWAYRALVVVAAELPAARGLGDACAGCPAPCVAACPADAVRPQGFDVPACHARRLVAAPCQLSCAARIACVRGPEHAYGTEALAFHMAASMPRRPRSAG